MGSTRDWLSVAFMAAFWGGWMLAWETHKRKAANLEPALLPASILVWILSGLNFGIFMVFRWRAFARPLVFATAACFVCSSVIAILYSRERSKAFKKRPSRLHIESFFFIMAGLALLVAFRASPVAYLSAAGVGLLYLSEYLRLRDQESRVIS